MQVVHLISSGGFYGAERVLYDHCRHVPADHRVIFLDTTAPLQARFRDGGIEQHHCQGLPALLQQLRQLKQQSRPLVLVSHNFKAQMLGTAAATLLRLPLIVTQHGFTPTSSKQRLYRRLSLALCHWPQVRAVACVSSLLAKQHRQWRIAASKLHVMTNALPASEPQSSKHGVSSVSRGSLRLGYAGRLSHEKGPDLLLQALPQLMLRFPQLQVDLVGDGPLRATLEEELSQLQWGNRVTLSGYQENIADWLLGLDLLVMPSRTEGTPMILLEAMQAGCPVVAFAVGGIPDVLNQDSGWLVPAEDVQALGAALISALTDDAARQQKALKAQARQQQHYCLSVQGPRWQQLYADVAGLSSTLKAQLP
ncbi:glycosyltransferase family 4 protein [Pokkaliibacter sp. CJK22405]|uniref:glycosyltransferase family 4 protein n=1 Tax=Pokkaliibacter sp. CJK22405 TaxID=3384615 RepID=UPI0039847821